MRSYKKGENIMQDANMMTPREFHEALNGKIGYNSLYQALSDKTEKGIKNFRVGNRKGKILIPSSEVTDWPRRLTESGY